MESNKGADNNSDKSITPFKDLKTTLLDQIFTLCEYCPSLISEFSLSYHITNCGLPPIYSSNSKCPCIECLVKPTCGKECEEFTAYRTTVGTFNKRVVEMIVNEELEGRGKRK